VTVAAQPRVFIVSGPSGSGKSTVVEHLLRAVPDTMFSVSYTTRKPRAGEQDGRDGDCDRRKIRADVVARDGLQFEPDQNEQQRVDQEVDRLEERFDGLGRFAAHGQSATVIAQ